MLKELKGWKLEVEGVEGGLSGRVEGVEGWRLEGG
jgi:hypothetical protein